LDQHLTVLMPAPAPVRLSKSKFVAGVQCLKRLYFQIYQPELAEAGDEGQEARFEQGNEVGLLAQSRFPGGVFVSSEHGLDGALAQTVSLLQDSSVPVLFEATFQHQGVLVRVDILQRRPGNRWRLIEVKSSVDVKEYHHYDIAIQAYVLRGCGLDLSSCCLMHLNRDYVYEGLQYDPKHLFAIRNLTRQIRKLDPEIPKLLKAERKALALEHPPDVAPGRHCSEPVPCEFYGCCNRPLPEHHISFLPRLTGKKQVELLDQGITLIHEIPESFCLSKNQIRIWTSVKTGELWISEDLANELSRLKYPLYFMDFETLFPAIPRFEGMWPYSHIPFQWSVHRQESSDGELEHFEFLAAGEADPRRDFLESLIDVLGSRGLIVAYNAGFESQRLGDLANWMPKYAERIAKLQARLWDLLPFVKNHLYHPQFHGSFSLKAVLPALVPGFGYASMEVSHGGEAGLAWDRMIRGGQDPGERQRLKAVLLAYCGQDTLAMTRVLSALRAVVKLSA
jgi:predicted RecB family nuclease